MQILNKRIFASRDDPDGGTRFRRAVSTSEPPSATKLKVTPWWTVVAAVSVAVMVVLNIIVAQTAVAPRTPWDEVIPLETARWLAGQGPTPQLSGAGYYPGWAIVLTPIWWFTQDPRQAYTAAISIVIVLAVLTLIPLTYIGRRLGLPRPMSLTAAALALSLPARTVNADYALSENLLAFLIACSVAAAFYLWERPTILRVIPFVAWVAAAYLTHPRALAVVLAAGVWLVLLSVRNVKASIVGIILLVGGYLLVDVLVSLVTEPVLLAGFGQGELLQNKFDNLRFTTFIRVAIAQSWGQFAGSLGLIAIGVAALAVCVWSELKKVRVGPFGFIAGMVFIAFVVSVVAWSNPGPQERFDAQVYTRYFDPFALPIVFLGIASLFFVARKWIVFSAGALAVGVSAVVIFKIAPWANTWGTMYGPANSASILAWAPLRPQQEFPHPLIPGPTNDNAFWFWATACLLLGIAIVAVLRSRPRVLSAVLVCSFATLSLFANPSQIRDYPAEFEQAVEQAESASGIPEGTMDVDIDLACVGPDLTLHQVVNWSSFWLSPRDVEVVDRDQDETLDSPLVVSCEDWDMADDYGAEAIANSGYITYVVWVMPGPVQDDMRNEGLLVEQPAEPQPGQ